MSEPTATPVTLERTLESLAFCQVQDEHRWAAARVVAQQDIDAFMLEAGSQPADQHHALSLLMAAFEQTFPHPADPVLIRSYMRRQLRRLGYGLHGGNAPAQEAESTAEIAPATVPTEADVLAQAESEHRATEPQKNG